MSIQIGDRFTSGLQIRKHGYYLDIHEATDFAVTEHGKHNIFQLSATRHHWDGTTVDCGTSLQFEDWLDEFEKVEDVEQAVAEMRAEQAEYDKQFEEWNKWEVSQ
ncbi:MAG: hypothetical protein ABJN62_11315 [Halioglobus sp.]